MGIYSISSIEGRYEHITSGLKEYFSEYALIRKRVEVEIRWLIFLSEKTSILSLNSNEKASLTKIFGQFSEKDAEIVKKIENEGYGKIKATYHDVKAVEYFLRLKLQEKIHPHIHLFLTSEDVNSIAWGMLIREAVNDYNLRLEKVISKLVYYVSAYKKTVICGHTHGQKAIPTTLGKEFANFAYRLIEHHQKIRNMPIKAKCNGAIGNYSSFALSNYNWIKLSQQFILSSKLTPAIYSNQRDMADWLVDILNSLSNINGVLNHLAKDLWLYITLDYLQQKPFAGSTGSSTMPQKCNPWRLESAEAQLNLAKHYIYGCISLLQETRLQRDLRDHQTYRNLGIVFGHSLIGMKYIDIMLDTLIPNWQKIDDDLKDQKIISEGIQTILRLEGVRDAYEQVKELCDNFTEQKLNELISRNNISREAKQKILSLTPENYIGYSEILCDNIIKIWKRRKQ